MNMNWSNAVNERYLQITEEEMRQSAKLLCLLGAILFPAFAFVDYTTKYDYFLELTLIRSMTSLIFGGFYVLMRMGKLRPWPLQVSLILIALATLSITLMCMVTGGLPSSYYAAINLIIMAAVLLFPGGALRLCATIVMVISIYLIGMLITHPFGGNTTHLVNNLAFILSTSVIGLSASLATERLRKQSFGRFLELKQTKDLLQGELKGHQGNIETLTRDLIERKLELERAFVMMTEAKEQTQEALQLREEFISLASHELKTPLTSLKLQTQIAKRQIEGIGEGKKPFDPTKVLDTFDYQVKRLTRMVEDMLDISRIRSGKLELELGVVNLTSLVEKLVERFQDKFAADGVSVTFQSQEQVSGYWDSYRIEQVLINLINNAIKYGEGRPVEVSVRSKGESAFLVVKDHGIGIPKASQAKIFKRFERAVSPMEFSGLGLGLYISEKIIQAHSGNIMLESEPGKGSTFTIRLPFNRENVDLDTLIEELTMVSAIPEASCNSG